MTVAQLDFVGSILEPSLPVPDGLSDPQGKPAGARFSVYRNNVAVGLTEALETAFPVIYKLVGKDFFQAMAGVFFRQYPPSSPLMMFYGVEMPGFLRGFDPVAHLGYLPDIARLELAMRQSYHAADCEPISPNALQALPTDCLMKAGLKFVPAMRLVTSEWPIYSIWMANTKQGSPAPEMRAESVLITRPDFDPAPNIIINCGEIFINSLQSGTSFGHAIESAGAEFDLSKLLSVLLSGRAILNINERR